MNFSPSTRQIFDAFVFWLSGNNSCSEEEKKEIVDSFNFGDFTAEELLTEVRLSGLYSISKISSQVMKFLQIKDEIIQKKDDLMSNQTKLINSNEALLAEKERQIRGLNNTLEAKRRRLGLYESKYGFNPYNPYY